MTVRDARRRADVAVREKVFEHYGGGVCACCGLAWTEWLCIDHVDGGGAAHRRALTGHSSGGGVPFYRRLIALGFPSDPPLQVLCLPCNASKRDGPHCRLHRILSLETPA